MLRIVHNSFAYFYTRANVEAGLETLIRKHVPRQNHNRTDARSYTCNNLPRTGGVRSVQVETLKAIGLQFTAGF